MPSHFGWFFLAREIIPSTNPVGKVKKAMNPKNGMIVVITPIPENMRAKKPVLFDSQSFDIGFSS